MTSARQEKKENANAVNMTRMAFETVETVENLQLQIIALKAEIEKIKAQLKQRQ